MDCPLKPSASKRGKKACTECRQQKAKCDAYLHPDRPCSRCQKVKAECVISDPFKREHKRQRLSELRQETVELRKKLKTSQSTNPLASSIANPTAPAEMGVEPRDHTDNPHPTVSLGSSLPRMDAVSDRPISDPTTSRALNGVDVTGDEIDEIFQLFFHRYAQFLPILDPQISPNAYYAQSPFLFWAVIGVACRSYSRNPTLLTALARSITDMALLSVASTSAPWHVIQGLLLILTWPFPKDNKPDVTFPLSGVLLHIAMQHGFHIPMSSHEFSRVKIPAPSEADMVRRSELWAHCIVAYQRACVAKGQSARTLANLEQDPGQSQLLFQRIAPSLVLKVKCQELVARCSAAVLENGVRTMTLDQERALDILLRSFETQVNDLEAQATSEGDRLNTTLCRMSIQSFHFYKNQTIRSTGCLSRVLATSCAVIDRIQKLSRLDALSTAPLQVFFGLMVSSTSLLRILKNGNEHDHRNLGFLANELTAAVHIGIYGPISASPKFDLELAKSSFFTAINLAKQMSIETNDTPAKSVIILNQLWNSCKAFRKPDGGEYTALRIRSRLVLSPVLDAVWWWRDEFDAQYRSMVFPQGEPSDGLDGSRDTNGTTMNTSLGLAEPQESLLFDDQFLADFEWALGDGAMFPPTEPYNTTWSSMGNLL